MNQKAIFPLLAHNHLSDLSFAVKFLSWLMSLSASMTIPSIPSWDVEPSPLLRPLKIWASPHATKLHKNSPHICVTY